MDKLTPTQRHILNALAAGPATTDQLAERTGRRHHVLTKALTGLAAAGHVTSHASAEESADGTDDATWALTQPDPETSNPEVLEDAGDPDDAAAPDTDRPEPEGPDAEAPDGHDAISPQDDATTADSPDPTAEALEAPPETPAENTPETAEAPEAKVCRGCQAQMPVVCPGCGRTTTSYCATCRANRPARRSGTGEPDILITGLPKLRRGELRQLVLGVLTSNPLPDHRGVVGWTPGRVAIFLPGRSTGAIGEALDRLVADGLAEQIGDSPRRYQLTNPETAAAGTSAAESADAGTAGTGQRGDDPTSAPAEGGTP